MAATLLMPVAAATTLRLPVDSSGTAQPLATHGGFPTALHSQTLVDNVDALAGLNVRILNARITEVVEPHAFIVESAPSGNWWGADHRDRILVLLQSATLRTAATPMVASPVTVVGVARTVFGIRASGEVPWPVVLDAARIKKLKVRASVLAASVQTLEGTELTDRR
jgi:hypothetical protein